MVSFTPSPSKIPSSSSTKPKSPPPQKASSSSSESDSDSEAGSSGDENPTSRTKASDPTDCYVCRSNPTSYAPAGCRHETLCKKCAMKQGTGGKCKVCGEMFFELKRVR